MFFIREIDIEANLEIEVRDLPDANGKMRPVRGFKYMWRDFDTVLQHTEVDPLDIVEVARIYDEEHGDPFCNALAITIEYYRQKYVLGID